MARGSRTGKMNGKSSAPQWVGRVHPQIAWTKLRALRDGAAIASKKLWS
jgi:hypothetical protein